MNFMVTHIPQLKYRSVVHENIVPTSFCGVGLFHLLSVYAKYPHSNTSGCVLGIRKYVAYDVLSMNGMIWRACDRHIY
jgi:hypothetical protein